MKHYAVYFEQTDDKHYDYGIKNPTVYEAENMFKLVIDLGQACRDCDVIVSNIREATEEEIKLYNEGYYF